MSAIASNSLINSLIGSIKAPDYSSLIKGAYGNSPATGAFANLMNQANQDNASRGQGILALLQGQGQQQMAQNKQNFNQQTAGIDQDMISKGLSNSTVGSNLKQGAQDQLNLANQGVSEHAALNLANMANSFTQKGPDLSMLANLMQQGTSAPTGNGLARNGAVSSSAAGTSYQLNNGLWQALTGGALSPYPML